MHIIIYIIQHTFIIIKASSATSASSSLACGNLTRAQLIYMGIW